jgi:hypothetical protein
MQILKINFYEQKSTKKNVNLKKQKIREKIKIAFYIFFALSKIVISPARFFIFLTLSKITICQSQFYIFYIFKNCDLPDNFDNMFYIFSACFYIFNFGSDLHV